MLTFKTILPSPLLQPIVQRFMLVEGEIPIGTTWNQLLIPSMAEVLFFNLNTHPQTFIVQGKKKVLVDSYVTGQYPQSFEAQLAGHVLLMGVHVNSPWLYQLFNVPIRYFENNSALLEDLIGREAVDLCSELRELKTTTSVIDRLGIFLKKMISCVKTNGHSVLLHSLSMIKKSNGTKRIHEIASDCKVSERMLQKVFVNQVGISPKEYSNMYRFNQVINIMMNTETLLWKEVVSHLGYFDQAHFINDFKKITNRNPSDYFINIPDVDKFFHNS
jgi:AraC-like DNA-binding protein